MKNPSKLGWERSLFKRLNSGHWIWRGPIQQLALNHISADRRSQQHKPLTSNEPPDPKCYRPLLVWISGSAHRRTQISGATMEMGLWTRNPSKLCFIIFWLCPIGAFPLCCTRGLYGPEIYVCCAFITFRLHWLEPYMEAMRLNMGRWSEGRKWAIAINSAVCVGGEHGGGTLYMCDRRNGVIAEMIWAVDLRARWMAVMKSEFRQSEGQRVYTYVIAEMGDRRNDLGRWFEGPIQ